MSSKLTERSSRNKDRSRIHNDKRKSSKEEKKKCPSETSGESECLSSHTSIPTMGDAARKKKSHTHRQKETNDKVNNEVRRNSSDPDDLKRESSGVKERKQRSSTSSLKSTSSREGENGSCVPSRRSRSKEKTMKLAILESLPMPNDVFSFENSREGTPQGPLSREGSSEIRIVDEETGEVFFRKKTKASTRKTSSVTFKTKAELSEETLLGKTSPSTMSQKSDNVGDILVFDVRNSVSMKNYFKKKNTNPFLEDGEEDEEEGSKSSLLKGILKKTQAEERKSKGVRSEEPSPTAPPIEARKNKSKGQSQRSSSPSRTEKKGEETNNNREVSPRKKSPEKKIDSDRDLQDDLSKSKKPSRTSSSKSTVPSSSKSRTVSRSSRSSKPDSGGTAPDHATIKEIPSRILRAIFSYLDREELKTCSQVCYRWKSITDVDLRGPLLFKGKSTYGHHYNSHKTKTFVHFLMDLEPKFYRPVELRFDSLSTDQVKRMCGKYEADFKASVKHIEVLGLIRCGLKWKALLILLSSFSSKLRILNDIDGDYYSQSLTCPNYRQRPKREVARKEFISFKEALKAVRRITIQRKTVTKELSIFLSILTQGTKYLEELELTLGPYETNEASSGDFKGLLSSFVKELRALISKNKDSLKIITFSWSDRSFTGYFYTCLDVLDKQRLNHLHTLSLTFDKHALTGKGSTTLLRNFLSYHYTRRLRQLTVERLLLSDNWTVTAEYLNNLLATIPPCYSGLDLKVVISDGKKMEPIHNILQLPIFYLFLSEIHFCIEDHSTKGLVQMFGGASDWLKNDRKYIRVRKVAVMFEPMKGQLKCYNHFYNFNVELLVTCFPNLTELRISDRLAEHNQIFTPLIGRKMKQGVSKAVLENKDLQMICKYLERLRVLKLWASMGNVDDHGVTGIHRGDISILHEEDEHFSWSNFHQEPIPSFSNLRSLEELSLRGLGPAVTDISLKFGFKNLERLKVLDLQGKMSITQRGQRHFRRRLKAEGGENATGGPIVKIKYCTI